MGSYVLRIETPEGGEASFSGAGLSILIRTSRASVSGVPLAGLLISIVTSPLPLDWSGGVRLYCACCHSSASRLAIAASNCSKRLRNASSGGYGQTSHASYLPDIPL